MCPFCRYAVFKPGYRITKFENTYWFNSRMTHPAILAPLSNLYTMQSQLLEICSDEAAARQYHPDLGSLNWFYAYSVYQELYWIRERLMGDNDLSKRIERLFKPNGLSLQESCYALPPREHLLNWGQEIRDEHLMRLANPATLPKHKLLVDDRLQWFLLQEQAKNYEAMLMVLNQRSLIETTHEYTVDAPLMIGIPNWETRELSQGHYRIGARDRPDAYDNELPPQAVELSSFRIALQPVSNSQYLTFIEANGYSNPTFWSEAGMQWLSQNQVNHPEYWRKDKSGNWFGIGINGPSDLPPDEPVSGINQYEAQAYANWVDTLGGDNAGAVLQHEYQWEMAVRTGVVKHFGKAWEWCNNPFHPYPAFQPFPDEYTSAKDFEADLISLRGGSLHTQPVLRRSSLRHRAPARQHFHISGMRLVFPPRHTWN